MSKWQTVIGIEVHTQLLTRSKMFCPCPNDYAGAEPNTHVCPICMGAPGLLPVVNEQALRYGIMAALALNCQVPEWTWFERKNYPYPDLVKGFQLTQYSYPIGAHGRVDVEAADGGSREIRVRRVHLEEDTAKNTHVATRGGDSYSLVDCNRAGVPLMEIVTEPDARSPEEAVAYLRKLRDILIFLGIASGRMESGAMRLEANVSVRTDEEAEQGVLRKRCEIKNLNSFDHVQAALEYEIKRQIKTYEQGGEVQQVTLGWDLARGRTVVQRSKEEAQDYRYFPEPDLPPLRFTTEQIDEVRAELPELRHEMIERFERDLGLDRHRAELLSQTRAFQGYFEEALRHCEHTERVANLLVGDFMAQVNDRGLGLDDMSDFPVAAKDVAELACQWERGDITGPQVKQLLPHMFETGQSVDAAKSALDIKVVGGEDALTPLIDQVLQSTDPKVVDAVEKLQAGNDKVLGFLVGQVMKASRGQANPQQVQDLLRSRVGVKG